MPDTRGIYKGKRFYLIKVDKRGYIVNSHNFVGTYRDKKVAYKAVKVCERNRWLPLKGSPFMASIVAYLIGDGNLSKDRMVGDFRFFANRVKLDNLKRTIGKKLNLFPHSYFYHPNGGCYVLRYNNSIFSRILELAGVPRGNKVLNAFSVPDWIVNGKRNIKREFLKALFSDEMGKLYLSRRGSWNGLKFKMSKSKKYLVNHIYFLQQLRELLIGFGITTSDVRIGLTERFRRKDGNVTYPAMFSINTNFENRRRFFKQVGFNDMKKQKLLNMSLQVI